MLKIYMNDFSCKQLNHILLLACMSIFIDLNMYIYMTCLLLSMLFKEVYNQYTKVKQCYWCILKTNLRALNHIHFFWLQMSAGSNSLASCVLFSLVKLICYMQYHVQLIKILLSLNYSNDSMKHSKCFIYRLRIFEDSRIFEVVVQQKIFKSSRDLIDHWLKLTSSTSENYTTIFWYVWKLFCEVKI